MPPKYQCTICNKTFRRSKQKDDHILFNRCKGKRVGTGKTMTLSQEAFPEQPRTTQYFGSPYNFNPIHTGNRHLRSGLPLPRLNPNMRCAI